MTIAAFEHLACPLDGTPMQCDGGSWRCADDHCFDIAREGYTHLLPVQQKRSRDPGDSKDMVAARRRFLDAGHYQPIADAVNAAVLAGTAADTALDCLDAGCGEGYYLRQLAGAIGPAQTLRVLGLDISKWAVLAAAKQDRRMAWVVGSNAHLPVRSAMLDRVLCLFGFPVFEEFARVLRPGGEVLLVDAGPTHLRELREIIYPTLRAERPANTGVPAGFEPLPGDSLQFSFTLDSAERIADLLAMTPHLFRASREGRDRLAAQSSLTLSADVRLRRLRRVA
jgi:23S rRNA (guanine745-N1)-methyltransferase